MPTQLHPRVHDVEWKTCVRYLDVHDDRSLCMIPQVNYAIEQSPTAQAKLRPVIYVQATHKNKNRSASWLVRNEFIAKDLRVQSIEDFVRTQARRLCCAYKGSIPSLHNLAPQYERPFGGCLLSTLTSPQKGKKRLLLLRTTTPYVKKRKSEPKAHAWICRRKRLQRTRRRRSYEKHVNHLDALITIGVIAAAICEARAEYVESKFCAVHPFCPYCKKIVLKSDEGKDLSGRRPYRREARRCLCHVIGPLKDYRGVDFKTSEDCDDVMAEIQQLELNLKQSQIRLIQMQRNALKRKMNPPKKKDKEFMRPQKIMVTSSIEHLKKKLDLYTMLTGMEVKSYIKNEHCCVVYHMQHSASHTVQHGLTINLENDDNSVSKYSLPIGFNYNAVMEDYDTVMTPECLRAVRKALVAYYDRLNQVNDLQKLLSSRISIFKIMDGSHLEISFTLHSMQNHDEDVDVVLILDYRVYDIRPKNYSFGENDMAQETINALKEQSISFKRESLSDAFRKSFLEGQGPYMFLDEPDAVQKNVFKRPAPRRDSDEDYNPDEDN
ncbi:hypothetical protein EVAR_41085_1 [Eumeta japonica]|uniref:Uncharacterized protein n=1 Tax=Eumeta variegata TaxID=151549 RepID=A0A4C1XT01_EUMVA|nr:hypothetical protein EVAR_41085_1 [Eumeta japonica]